MAIKKQVRRRVIETLEYEVELPISMPDLLAAIAEVKDGLSDSEFTGIQIDVAGGTPDLFRRAFVFTVDHEVTEPTPHPPLPPALRSQRPKVKRDDDPVPTKDERPVEDVSLPEVDHDKPHEFEGTELVPGWCKHCGEAPWTKVHGGTGEPPKADDQGDAAPVVPPFPTTPEAGKDVELTQEIAFLILDHPGTWYFKMEGASVKEEDKSRNRYRLRLNRAKNKHVHGEHILVETRKHRNPQALEVTIVR